MKKVKIAVISTLLVLSGTALAGQPAEQKKGSSMRVMMQEMMSESKSGEGDMGEMMGMMKMMNQCSAMMEEHQRTTEKAKEGQNE